MWAIGEINWITNFNKYSSDSTIILQWYQYPTHNVISQLWQIYYMVRFHVLFINHGSGTTRATKAWQKSLVPARQAKWTNQVRTHFICTHILSFNSQQGSPLSSLSKRYSQTISIIWLASSLHRCKLPLKAECWTNSVDHQISIITLRQALYNPRYNFTFDFPYFLNVVEFTVTNACNILILLTSQFCIL